jgi:pyrimidine operon attenuation protein/uracil phosphoribosyltransferase
MAETGLHECTQTTGTQTNAGATINACSSYCNINARKVVLIDQRLCCGRPMRSAAPSARLDYFLEAAAPLRSYPGRLD